MNIRARIFFAALAVLAIPVAIQCQNAAGQDENKGGKGSITGKVTKEGNPVAGAVVVLLRTSQHSSSDQGALARARTGPDGRYHIADIASGAYRVEPLVPAYVTSDTDVPSGVQVRVPEGEDVDGVDFSLVRGGVITGRVTDQDGTPLSNQQVTLHATDDQGHMRPMFAFQHSGSTDDRGVYRIYGLPAGTYTASVGMDPRQTSGRVRARFYKQTFSPGVTEESKARQVSVTTGSEAAGVDIRMGLPSSAHTVTGRMVDAETNAPLPNLTYGFGEVSFDKNGVRQGFSFSTGGTTNALGGFRIEGLLQGKYFVTAVLDDGNGLYSDIRPFEVSDQDISALEVRVHHGSTIVGSALLEGVNGPDIAGRIPQLELLAWPSATDESIDGGSAVRRSKIGADGSFRFAGLRPGKFWIGINGTTQAKGFFLKRVQGPGVRDAAAGESGNGQIIEIGEAQVLAGLEAVLSYANGVIRGQIRVEGGELPRNANLNVSVSRREGFFSHGPIEVDGNGRFVIDGLEAGDYAVAAYAYPQTPASGQYTPLGSANQRVTVKNGSETEAILVIDLSGKARKDQ